MQPDTLNGPKALGAFLRAHRERLTPAQAGLPRAPRRRTSGLRREELAQLSGISTTWYTWIEQGRDVSVSPLTLARLARALQLGTAERDYLFSLAQASDPEGQDAADAVSPALLASVQQIHCPGYLLDSVWNVISWNAPAQALFSGFLGSDPAPNLLNFMFLHPLARVLVADWPERARRVVAEFRAETRHFPHSEPVREQIQTLCRASVQFNGWWHGQTVMAREGGLRRFHHPQRGDVLYRQQTFYPAGSPALKLVMLLPGEDAENIDTPPQNG
ncbi:transcriptional regulator [Chimaeribacter californicus]|uniref:Transcriptional regulator n=1 Tax=Chimaeribacter californicus TaxID=2060067 RepID=A0A2N5DYJ6_9GAMM|nr:helix-turn-helix transcriptional regulator [Chimaeribacter californicus]PLR32635.1 transcriptional regulator [Chimaeribacter californicus]